MEITNVTFVLIVFATCLVAGCDTDTDFIDCWEEYHEEQDERANCVYSCADNSLLRDEMTACWEDGDGCIVECMILSDWHKTAEETNCVIDCPGMDSISALEDCLGEDQPQCYFPEGY